LLALVLRVIDVALGRNAVKNLVLCIRAVYIALFKPFASSKAIKSGMGPMSEGNPSGWFH
jgi:hypothetical protein